MFEKSARVARAFQFVSKSRVNRPVKYRVSPRALERIIELISARYHAAQYSQLSALIARHRTLPPNPRQQQHNDEKKNHREIKRIN